MTLTYASNSRRLGAELWGRHGEPTRSLERSRSYYPPKCRFLNDIRDVWRVGSSEEHRLPNVGSWLTGAKYEATASADIIPKKQSLFQQYEGN